MAFSPDGFDRSVSLPPGLRISHVKNAIDFVEERAQEWLDIYFEQANIFSGVIGILGVRALDSLTPYKRHKHSDVAQQRFPICHLAASSILRLWKHSNRKEALARGPFNRITTTLDGT